MKRELFNRAIIYITGMLLLALGITLNTRTNLGVSPLISVAFCVSYLLDVNIGDMTLIWYMIFVLIEIVCHISIKKYRVILADILQIPLSIVFTRFMNLFTGVIPNMTGNILIRLLFLTVAIILTGMGIVFTLNVRMIPNPGDGIVQALSDCCGKKDQYSKKYSGCSLCCNNHCDGNGFCRKDHRHWSGNFVGGDFCGKSCCSRQSFM